MHPVHCPPCESVMEPKETNRIIMRSVMSKIIECSKVDPSSGCNFVARGKDEKEVLQKAAEHAKEHGIHEVSPELMKKVRSAIRDE